MKILKILGILFGLLVVAAAGVWFAVLRAPSVESQCAHVLELMEAKAPGVSDTPVGKEFLETCPDQMKKGRMQGQMPYVKQAKCVMAATAIEELEACEK